jgi:hypothetical protein
MAENIKKKGFIHFITMKEDGTVTKELNVPNIVTELGDVYFDATSGANIFALMRGIEEAVDFVNSPLFRMNNATTISTGDDDNNLCVYLLNLTESDKASLSADSRILPIYTPGTFAIDSTKIVGWASLDRSSTQAKQGVLSSRATDTILNPKSSSVAWEWAVGKATGTFNCIAVGVNVVNTSSYAYAGLSIFRGLENNDVNAGDPNPSGYYARPGISGITSANEILLGGTTTDGRARIKWDLVSNVKTELTATDAAYDFKLSMADTPQVIIGTKVFYIYQGYVWVYDTVAKTHSNTNIYPYRYWMFAYNGYLYVPGSTTTCYAYDTSSYANVSAQNKTISEMLGIPNTDAFYNPLTASSYRSFLYWRISNYGDTGNFLISFDYNSTREYKRAFVVSNLFTANTVVDILPRVSTPSAYTINNEIWMFDYNTLDNLIQNITGQTTNTISSFGSYGTKWSKFFGNMISFKIYDTPLTIAADEVAKVEYAYKSGS